MVKNKVTSIFVLCLLSVFSSTTFANVKDIVFGEPVKKLLVPVGHSRILLVEKNFTNISVGDPRIADVIVLDAKKIYILGKALGSTNVVLWERVNNRAEHVTFNVDVTHDVESMKQLLHELMPEEKPEIRSSQGAMVISGEVSSSAKVDAIHRIATQFVNNSKEKSDAEKALQGKNEKSNNDDYENSRSTEVINLLQVGGPHQIQLEVKVAEISRSVLKRMGVNLLAVDRRSKWNVGAVNGGAIFPGGTGISPSTPSISVAGLFASYLSKDSLFNIVLEASKDDGLTKILAEPTLTTTSGESASFLSGGEFPLPVWSGDNRITVTYKEYGIKMKALPVVLDSKKINIQLEVEVSELSDGENIAAGIPGADFRYVIPALTTRKTKSTVDLLDGQTIGIAGLISDKMREAYSKFPGIGDMPVLGALFRSQDYIQDQTELVMFVTAHLAKPITPGDIKLPTDSFENPSDLEFYLLGRMQAQQPYYYGIGDPSDPDSWFLNNKQEQTDMENGVAVPKENKMAKIADNKNEKAVKITKTPASGIQTPIVKLPVNNDLSFGHKL